MNGAEGVPDAWCDARAYYFTNPHAIVGPNTPVRRPVACRALDFELEVADAISDGGTSLTEERATDMIFGCQIFNDWSAREIQAREMQVGLGPPKGKDYGTSLGPWLVTADELDDARDAGGFLDLSCIVEVNGVEIGRDRLNNMGWTLATMIVYASRVRLGAAGDVLSSGAVGGGGCVAELWGRRGRQDPRPVEPGDVVALNVDRLGTLSNVVSESTAPPSLAPFRPAPETARS